MFSLYMTKKSKRRLGRQGLNWPPAKNIASVRIDHENQRVVFTTNNMLINQLRRDGPIIAKSFDKVASSHLDECSAIFGKSSGLIVRHLPNLDSDDFKPTAARLLMSACHAYLASVEIARHGYRRQYGVMARSFVETLATVIVLTIRPTALSEFHAGKLSSSKCIGWAKAVIEPIGLYYGMLSDQFTHIGVGHAAFEPLIPFKDDDEELSFIGKSMRGNAWLLYVVTELVYHDEISVPRYWFAQGGDSVAYDPSEEERAWMNEFLV